MMFSQSSVISAIRMPIISCIALLIVFQIPVLSQELKGVKRTAVPIEDTEQFQKRITKFMQSAREKTGFSGVVVVAREGKAIYQGAFGYSHIEAKTPNTTDTPFRIASLSKQFTAAAILHLEAEGKLSVDDPIHHHLPEFSNESHREITIYHLLTHTSGLPGSGLDPANRARWRAMSKKATPVMEYVRLANEVPLKYETGQGWEYSNFGFRILSAVIVRVTGKEFADFMEEEVFKPLGMNQTGVARITRPESEAKVADGLIFQGFDDETGEPVYSLDDSGRNYGCGYGSGGIYTSANDLIRWDRILTGDGFLPAKQRATLFRPLRNNYACGWGIRAVEPGSRISQSHSGGNEAYHSLMVRIPEEGLAFVILGNFDMTKEFNWYRTQLSKLCVSQPYEEL